MELQGVTPLDSVVLLPLVGGPVAARGEEAMQDGQEDRPLDVELEAASVQELVDGVLAPSLLPESLKDQGRPDAPGGDGGESSLGVGREQQYGLGQASPRGQQGVESSVLLELIESSRSGDDPLSGTSILPAVLNDLEVGA
jgi:hypothetical protein